MSDNRERARQVVEAAQKAGVMIATAESCTGGLIAGALTDIAGSSSAFDCGFVTYSNDAKTTMLNVPAGLIGKHGAVSTATAEAMADGALRRSIADLVVAVTGIAGPGGGSDDRPVGLVHFAVRARGGQPTLRAHRFREDEPDADRTRVRELTVKVALDMLLEAMPD